MRRSAWPRSRWGRAVAAGVACAGVVLAVVVAAASAGGPLPNRTYDAQGGSATASDENIFTLYVHRNGRLVTIPGAPFVFTCTGGGDAGQTIGAATVDGTGSLSSNGSLAFWLPAPGVSPGGPAEAPVRVIGRFVSGSHVSGTLAWAGNGEAAGCAATQTWSATVEPRYQRFAGHTAPGTHVTLQRTIEAHPEVQYLSFGTLETTCPGGGGTEPKEIDIAPDFPVHDGRFSFTAEDVDGEDADVTGRFTSATQARGTVGVVGRDDCYVDGVRWVAHLVGTGP